MTSRFVVEFEGFNLSDRFVFKELVIFSLDKDEPTVVRHFYIRPPFKKSKLKESDKNQVEFCERNLHRLKWNTGFHRMLQVFAFFKCLPRKSLVYTKGDEKVKILDSIIDNRCEVIDLDEEKCPRVNALLKRKCEQYCPLNIHHGTLNCAFMKAKAYANYMQNERTY